MSRNLVRSLLVFVLSLFSVAALAHDVWISRGTYKNPAGEWCCGAEDCGVVSRDAVTAGTGGYSLRGPVTYGMGVTGNEADGPNQRNPLGLARLDGKRRSSTSLFCLSAFFSCAFRFPDQTGFGAVGATFLTGC